MVCSVISEHSYGIQESRNDCEADRKEDDEETGENDDLYGIRKKIAFFRPTDLRDLFPDRIEIEPLHITLLFRLLMQGVCIAFGTVFHKFDALCAVLVFAGRIVARQAYAAGKNYLLFILHNSSFKVYKKLSL